MPKWTKHPEYDGKQLMRWENLTRDFLYALHTKHAITKKPIPNTHSKIQNPTAVEINSLAKGMVVDQISSYGGLGNLK